MNLTDKKLSAITVISLLAVVIVALGAYLYYFHKKSEAAQLALNNQIAELETHVKNVELERTSLSDALDAERVRNADFEDQVKKLTNTVGVLDKLSKTDPELLKKYSKVYFLNEHYEPPRLLNVTEKYLSDPDKPQQIHRDVWPFLKRLLERADDDRGLHLLVASAYRSFGTQAGLKSSYRVTYGAGTANQFSADQGYSEHQLGTAIDFTTPATSATLDGFENTPEYKWLEENAYKYGFVLSYPPNNSYYQYEPWHWRFVGIELAARLHEDNQYFYDLDQRTIDQYLINIFEN